MPETPGFRRRPRQERAITTTPRPAHTAGSTVVLAALAASARRPTRAKLAAPPPSASHAGAIAITRRAGPGRRSVVGLP